MRTTCRVGSVRYAYTTYVSNLSPGSYASAIFSDAEEATVETLITPTLERDPVVAAQPIAMAQSSPALSPTMMDFDPDPEVLRTPTLAKAAASVPMVPTTPSNSPSTQMQPPSTRGHIPAAQVHTPPSVPFTANSQVSGSSRPLPLPEALESIIHHAIIERLDSTTTNFIDSTVRGVVDACIPRLEEFISSKLTSITQHKPKYSEDREGWEGDDEDEDGALEASVLSRRKKPGPRGHMNHLHVSLALMPCPWTHPKDTQTAFRRYLEQKGVMITQSGTVQNLAMPNPDQVRAFNHDAGSPPTIENISIDWKSSLKKSPWNQEVIRLLALDFQSEIQSGVYPSATYDPRTITIQALSQICSQKLSRTHRAYRQHGAMECNSDEHACGGAISKQQAKQSTQRKNDRSNARKHGVRKQTCPI